MEDAKNDHRDVEAWRMSDGEPSEGVKERARELELESL